MSDRGDNEDNDLQSSRIATRVSRLIYVSKETNQTMRAPVELASIMSVQRYYRSQ